MDIALELQRSKTEVAPEHIDKPSAQRVLEELGLYGRVTCSIAEILDRKDLIPTSVATELKGMAVSTIRTDAPSKPTGTERY